MMLSSAIIIGLLWVAFYVEPTAMVREIEPSPFGRRENYLGAVVPNFDGSVLWAVGRKGRIIRSDDHGHNWEIQRSPVKHVHLQDIAAWDDQSAIVAGDQGTLLVTFDGGINWLQRELPLREFGEQLNQVKVEHGSNRAWVVGSMGSVFFSEDRGESWSMVHPEEDVSWYGIDVTPDGVVWVTGEFGRMSKSQDGGRAWEEVDTGTGQSLMDVTFADAKLGVAVGMSGTVLVTVDGGERWTPQDTGTEFHVNGVAWDEERFVAVGGGGILLASDADGLNWVAGTLGSNNAYWYITIVPIMSIPAGSQYLAVGANIGISHDDNWQPFLEIHDGSANQGGGK